MFIIRLRHTCPCPGPASFSRHMQRGPFLLMQAALAKRMAKMEKSLLAVENKLNIALEDLSDSSEQTRDQLQVQSCVQRKCGSVSVAAEL